MPSDTQDVVTQLARELANFEEIARHLVPKPGDLPALAGIDVHGGTLALSGVVGGDHLIYVDFKQRFDLEARIEQALQEGLPDVVHNLRRCQKKAGIALLDVSGHHITDAFLASMIHQAFLIGAMYELDQFGHITGRLFENLNTRFYQSSGAHRFVSMTYGEISEDARFRFISAAQPHPMVFSRQHDRFMNVDDDLRVSFPPLGMLPSLDVIDRRTTTSVLGFKQHYQTNEWVLMGEGDILLLCTDGLVEHGHADQPYCPEYLEQTLRGVKDQSAATIFRAITEDLLAFCQPADDISIVVIKRA
jgi:serine phosphatase RsbU (regulator of sigma subunit)